MVVSGSVRHSLLEDCRRHVHAASREGSGVTQVHKTIDLSVGEAASGLVLQQVKALAGRQEGDL